MCPPFSRVRVFVRMVACMHIDAADGRICGREDARLRAGQTDKVPFTPPGATEQAALEARVEANSVSPHRFKALIGRGHSEFGSPHQQDACEFFIYLMQLLERSERVAGARLPAAGGGAAPLSSLFKFSMEQRTQCATTGAVSYKHLEQNVLHVDIPLEAASNGQARSAPWPLACGTHSRRQDGQRGLRGGM